MENYEGLFIMDADLSQDAIKAAIESVTDTVTKQAGTIGEVQEWGRRKLTYEIRKKREGYYVLVHFAIATAEITRLHQLYKLNDQILKYMITRRLPPRKLRESRLPRKQLMAFESDQ